MSQKKNKALTAEDVTEKFTVKELKDILRENDLSVSGKKSDLVERVLPILNNNASETSGDDADLTKEESLSSTLTNYGINYNELAIIDQNIFEGKTELNIEGFTRNGILMSDSTLSIDSTDPSFIDLKMNIPEVSYSDFERTFFTFKNLDLSILPSGSPQSLELSALMDSLEIISDRDYVNLKGLICLPKLTLMMVYV